jgi:two-component system phosphate regulon sensor histidine kinase PhoR
VGAEVPLVTRSFWAWLLFVLVAALPAGAVLAIAIRAADAELVRAEREQTAARFDAARAVERDVGAALLGAAETLRGLTDPRVAVLAEQLRAKRPPYTDVIVLDVAGVVVYPPAPAADLGSTPACLSARDALTTEGRGPARDRILADCPDLRSESGRYLWPLLDIEADSDAALGRLSDWLRGHDGRLGRSERAVVRGRVAKAPPSAARAAALAELDHAPSLHSTMAELVSDPSGDDTFDGSLRTHRGRYVSVLRMLEGGTRAGYIVDEASLARDALLALAASELALKAGKAGDASDVSIAPRLAMRVVARDAESTARAAKSRARRDVALTAGVLLLSVALAAALFARARRAQRLAELRTDFVAAVSHELRTPLASVRMLAELLEAGDVEASERAEIESTLAGETRRLGATLDRMLRFGALARGKLVVDRRRAIVKDVLDDCAARFRTAHPEKDVVVVAYDQLAADLDAGLVALALDNLLSNAAKYAPDGGPYRLESESRHGRLVLSVSDRGPGLDRRAQARVFLPFERADDRLSRATEGTGVGLALVRGIARAHGGDATVESAPARGSTFILAFPIARTRDRS